MLKKLLTLVILYTGFVGFTQEVPKVVQNAFSKKFPNAAVVMWEQLEDNTWQVFYKFNRDDYSSVFSEGGNWVCTKYSISIDDIPEKVKIALEQHIPGQDVSEVEVKKTGTGTTYLIAVIDDYRNVTWVSINEKGEVLSITNASEEEIEFEEEEEEFED